MRGLLSATLVLSALLPAVAGAQPAAQPAAQLEAGAPTMAQQRYLMGRNPSVIC